MPPYVKEISLRRCFAVCQTTHRRVLCSKKCFSTRAAVQKDKHDKSFAVIGGGLSGLSTAFYLSKEFPDASITLFEKCDRLGGWIRSDEVDLGDRKVIFERGPRTLRTGTINGLLTLKLVQTLVEDGDISSNEVLSISKNSPNSNRRFLYYPDHLVELPNAYMSFGRRLWQFFTEPLYKKVFFSLVNEISTDPRSHSLQDESIGNFLLRRTRYPDVANNIFSALVHGIYAGDIWKLSMRSIAPMLWQMEIADGGIQKSAAKQWRGNYFPWRLRADHELLMDLHAHENERSEDVLSFASMDNVAMYTFDRGMESLPKALTRALERHKNTTIKTGTDVRGGRLAKQGKVELSIAGNKKEDGLEKLSFDNVIFTGSFDRLGTIFPDAAVPSTSPYVTVDVINLYYSTPNLIHEGFGYLIPQSVPFVQNPEMCLGVIYDSNLMPQHDSAAVPGTKITVMLGGHYWDGWKAYPSDSEAVNMAKNLLKRHLGITETPMYAHASIKHDCIPQFTVGHLSRVRHAHQVLQTAYKGKLRVAGNNYEGVGMTDCVRSAFDLVKAFANQTEPQSSRTGLEQFAPEQRVWIQADNSKDTYTVWREGERSASIEKKR